MKSEMLQDSRSMEKCSLSDAIQTSQPISWWLWSITNFPQLSSEDIQSLVWVSYQQVALNILWRFDFWISLDELEDIINESYWKQWHRKEITPVKKITNEKLYSLHLWYWPTFAFKNIALEFLPRLLSRLTKWKLVHVLWASSWDTINAAHSWVIWTNIRSIFMLPNKWPSEIQRLQAVNWVVWNDNALTLLADTPFDPLQKIVKEVNWPDFKEFKENHNITSFNSINIARILAQVVYYFRAYTELVKNWEINNWDEVVFSIPSWNFWDALACYYAKKMWLPIHKILVATNENDMLDRFFKEWVYEPPKKNWKNFVDTTNSPSMDIAQSSNLERMIFDICWFDNDMIKQFYENLKDTWKFVIDNDTLKRIQEMFVSSSSTNEERLNIIKQFWDEYWHWIDPHTAAWLVPRERCDHWLRAKYPVIFLETSHVAQFWKELRDEKIIVPWMDEFDDTLNKIRQNKPVEWKDYLMISWELWDAIEKIQYAITEIFK